MKKTTIFILATLVIMSVGSLVLANSAYPSYHHNGYGYNNNKLNAPLNDEQKAQLEQAAKQHLEQMKKMLSDQAAWGWISQEQANREISRMEQSFANGNYDAAEMGAHHGNHGRGEHGGGHW